MTRNLTGIEQLSHWEDAEAVGILISVNDGKIVLEARRRFEIRAKAPTSLRNALGKVVGVAVIDGRIRWRLVETAPEPGEGGPP
jgi:hypothetical protein